MKKPIKAVDICPKSYTGEHFWREGSVYRPLSVFGLTFQTIHRGKPVQIMTVCSACGIMKEVINGS